MSHAGNLKTNEMGLIWICNTVSRVEGAATLAQCCDCNYFVIQVLDQIAFHFIPRGTHISTPSMSYTEGFSDLYKLNLTFTLLSEIHGEDLVITFKVRTNKMDVKHVVWFEVIRWDITWLWNEILSEDFSKMVHATFI